MTSLSTAPPNPHDCPSLALGDDVFPQRHRLRLVELAELRHRQRVAAQLELPQVAAIDAGRLGVWGGGAVCVCVLTKTKRESAPPVCVYVCVYVCVC
jgi:hypothetical protein